MNGFRGKVFCDGNWCPGNINWHASEVDVDEFVLLVEVRSNVEGPGRSERNIGAAEVGTAVEKYILVKIFSGVSTLIHRKSVFLVI